MKRTDPLGRVASGATGMWTVGARLRARLYQHGLFRQKRLRAKVISIGNISWGGTGKTPVAMWLAGRLQAAGLRVSILTRGYGRRSPQRVHILPPGADSQLVQELGDEVQLYLRHLELPIGVAASRYEAGCLLEDEFPVDVHLLDDGFQHLSLARDVDLVLVDASNPWGARNRLPRLLREGPSALRRAHAVLLTRCESAEDAKVEALRETVRRVAPASRLFTVRTRLLHFVAASEDRPVGVEKLRSSRAFAFCGLGSPDNFFRRLEIAGIGMVGQKAFPDHHRYRLEDVQWLEQEARARRADCFVTTEKDRVNLPGGDPFSLPVYWAAVEPVVEPEGAFWEWLREQLTLPPERLPGGANFREVARDKLAAGRRGSG